MFRYIGNFLLELMFSTNLACFVFTCIAGYIIWKGGMEGLAAHDLMLLASSTIWMFVTVVLSFMLPALPVEIAPQKRTEDDISVSAGLSAFLQGIGLLITNQ